MASRHADQSRSRHEERGGGRYAPPRRDRGDRYEAYPQDRRRDDRRDDPRDSDRRGDRFDGRRRDRDRRRSRSPAPRDRERARSPGPRRDRSRDRFADDRYHGDRSRTNRDRDRGYDERPRDTPRRRDDARGSYTNGDDRRRGSSSATTSSDMRRGPDGSAVPLTREEKQKLEQEKTEKDKEAEKKAKLAKVAEWKKAQAEKKAKQEAETASAAASSPAVTAPSTPAAAQASPVADAKLEPPKVKPPRKSVADKTKQIPKSTFKFDETAKAKPLLSKSAGNPVVTQHAPSVNNRTGYPSKATGNMSSFGLKAKADAAAESAAAAKNALLDDEDKASKRTLQALPDFTPLDESSLHDNDDDDAAMSDIGSDDEETNAHLQAQLEKRREEIANEDTQMQDAPTVAAEEAADKMDVDDAVGAADDEDVDPLDAFMAGLSEPPLNGAAPQGQALFGDDIEPDMTAVEEEDLLAHNNSKKKRKDVPVVDHKKVEYEPFRKNFYTEPTEVSEMTTEQVADLRLELDGIKVKPDDVPRPVTKWAQMGLLQPTMNVFETLGYSKPTSIQSQAIPIAESGLDLIGVAKTGSGKTLAFGIPMIRHVLDQRPLKAADGPIVLILAPTRELSLQIVAELKPFLKASNLKIACAYGGPPISEQIAMIKRGGIHVLCATPGRLIDLLQSNSGRVLSFKRITYAVLDEADRMFDMGFEPQVMKILANIRPDRQAILFSATFPKNMAALARKALRNPVEVIIGGRSVVNPAITQSVEVVPSSYEKKISRLLLHLGQLFNDNEDAQALIFVERQETAEDLLARLMKKQYPVNTIHGGKDQSDRTESINNFKANIVPILIATSVAARGLDIPELPMVINFDCPTHLEDYVHRCGRTGRAGNKGTAITFIETPGQERFAGHLIKALKQSGQDLPKDLLEMSKTFNDKVKAGAEKWYDPGFGGKGLDKLDAARMMDKSREKRSLKGALKEFGDGDQSDDEAELSNPIVKKTEAPVASASATPGTPRAPTADDDEPVQPAWMKTLTGKISVQKTERPTADASKTMSPMERVRAAANKVDGRLSKKGMIHHGQPIDNKGPDAGAYHATIEINDFPQKARWAVTNRTNVAKILEQTGTSITTKGNYYALGKEPNLGEHDIAHLRIPANNPTDANDLPKLYILVEGDTENVVTSAIMELKRLLKEATEAAGDEPPSLRAPTGRYSVV